MMKDADIPAQVRAARAALGLRQADLAERAGVTIRTLRNLETGENSTLDTLARISRALGVELVIRPNMGMGGQ